MNCPRCKSPIGPLEAPDAIITCPGCGSRLMTRSAALRSQGGARPPAPAVPPLPPSLTAPPAPARPHDTKPSSRVDSGDDTVLKPPTKPSGKPRDEPATGPDGATLEAILEELRAVRETQQAILEALESLHHAGARAGSPGGATAAGDDERPVLSPIRARRRKTVVIVDDDPASREAAVAELQHADVPVRAFEDGNAALAGIAEDKPDVIVLELGLGGEMGGKDLVNMIKATMEWVDIPVILWTREAVSGQKEARQLHGADEVVPKSDGAAALVARVITVFRRG